MGEQNKILDVTYGKFSCRLEGFDDAVETMKTVVSYFHDLVGHENFVEMAPGMPDLDTLAKLAETQAGGVVTAESNGDGISLTRIVGEDEAQAEAEIAVDETYPEENAFAEDGNTHEDEDTPEDTPVLSEEAESDEAAAQFDEADYAGAELEIETAEEIAEAPETEASNDDTDIAAMAAEDSVAEDVYSASDDQIADEMTGEETFEDTSEEATEVSEAHQEEESVASRLDRIRAVITRGAAGAKSEEPTDAAPQPAPEPAPLTVRAGNPLAQRLAELAKRNSVLMDADTRAQAPALTPEDAHLVSDEDTPVAAEETYEEAATYEDQDAAHVEDAAEDDWSSAQEVLAEDSDEDTLAQENALEAPELDPGFAVDDNAEADDVDNDELNAFAAEDAAAAEEDDAPQSVDDYDDTAANDDDEIAAAVAENDEDHADEMLDDPADEVAATSQDDRPKSVERPLLLTTPQRPVSEDIRPEDEDEDFDLSAELAEIEKEIAARPRNEMSRHGLPRSVEDAMSRIFTETNQQLDAPEGRRHRDALAQLKAAVAATEAAKRLGDSTRSRDANEDFRNALGALDAENRKKAEGLPPLKLVKTVDEEEEARDKGASDPRVTSKPLDVAADRLREIAATKEPGNESGKSVDFVAFLEQQGVTDLGDKLEAAAAYLTFIDGEPDFTRPQLMRLVQSASREEITREDGLRCFGRLLRQSRFAKLNNGRFKVDDNTPFRPRTSRLAQG